MPLRGVPPISERKVACARKRLRVRTASSTTTGEPLMSSRETSMSSGRYRMCGERPATTIGTTMIPMTTRRIPKRGSICVSPWVRRGIPSKWRANREPHSPPPTSEARRATQPSRRRREASRARPTSATSIGRTRWSLRCSMFTGTLLWRCGLLQHRATYFNALPRTVKILLPFGANDTTGCHFVAPSCDSQAMSVHAYPESKVS
jgi:hypothetical protein